MDTWQVITKPRAHKKRMYIILILTCIALHQACLWGEFDITMLYVRHGPLWWNSAQYGYYLAGGYLASGKCRRYKLLITDHIHTKCRRSTFCLENDTFCLDTLGSTSYTKNNSWLHNCLSHNALILCNGVESPLYSIIQIAFHVTILSLSLHQGGNHLNKI